MEERGSFIIGSKSKFTMIPNMVAHLGLSTFAFRLYFAYCETIGAYGESDKACFKTVRTLAKECNMGISSISRHKKELENAGLITVEISDGQKYKSRGDGTNYKIGGAGSDVVYIVDIWEINAAFKKGK